MDWQLRIALIIAGCALVGYVYYDYAKKKRLQKENEKLKKQFNNIAETVDSAGFDHVGVGTPRPASVESDQISQLQTKESARPHPKVQGSTVEQFIDSSLGDSINPNASVADPISENQEKTSSPNVQREPTSPESESEESVILESAQANNADKSTNEPEKAMVLSLILQAPQGTKFKGKDFLPLFLSQGLRHGEMGIFHRRARAGKDPGPVLFSLANGIAPGTFEINNMENFETPALACFVTLPGPDDAQVAYNAMYKTCLLLQQELGGELLDESKSVYSKQTHNHRLDQIKDYSFKFGD